MYYKYPPATVPEILPERNRQLECELLNTSECFFACNCCSESEPMTTSKTSAAEESPQFHTDYDVGWIGFVHGPNLLSRGIAYLTRWDRDCNITISHTFIVAGRNECVEANLPVGVVVSNLAEEYLQRPERHVFFRRPRGLTAEATERITQTAQAQVGTKFDFGVFAASALTGTFLGHLLNALSQGKWQEGLDKLLHQNGRWICSDLVAYCLQQVPEYQGLGVLAKPPGTLNPQELFEDDILFDTLTGPAHHDSHAGDS